MMLMASEQDPTIVVSLPVSVRLSITTTCSEIRKLKTLAYRVGKYQEKFKKNERFMFQAILSTDAKIKTLDETEFEKARAEFSEN